MKLKKVLSVVLICVMLASTVLIGVTAADTISLPFDDVPNKWYKNAVTTVYNEGIMTGKSDTKFDPTAKITRAEVVTAFARIACTNIDGYGDSLGFTDTKTGKWYSDSVGWAAENGIVKGRGDGRFSPNDKITRAELASIIVNFVGYMELKLPTNAKVDKFADASTFAKWMKTPVEEVRRTGLMQGDSAGKFNPKGDASRAEIAQVITNLLPRAGRTVVVENGKSDYVIVAGEEYADAAERLQYQIKYTTGVELKIVDSATSAKSIVIGNTDANTDALGSDGYVVSIYGEKVFIDGETPEGAYRGAVRFALATASGNDVRFTDKTSERRAAEYPIKSLKINGNDISKYVICYGNASETTMIGVNALVKYIELATGVKVPAQAQVRGDYSIVVQEKTVIAEGAGNDCDTFKVKSEGTSIHLTGDSKRGAMYACYDLLEKIGCRFLTEKYEYIIPADEVDIKDLDYTESSVFENRRIYAHTFNASKDMRNKLRDVEGRTYVGPNCHTFDGLDGSYSSQYESQPCLTNEAVFELMLENIMKLLDANPDARLISVSQNDNTNYCKCDNCMASYAKYTKDPDDPEMGGTAGNMIEFINRISDEITKKYPDVYIHMFAYTYTRYAPANIKPRDNIVVQLCSIENCFSHGLASSCGANSDFEAEIKEWASLAKTLYIWDYNNNFAHRATPFPNLTYDVLAANMRLFADNNVRGLFLQGNGSLGENGEFDRLRWYLESKLAWDPYMSEEEYDTHMREFMQGFYGDGWKNVYDAMTLLHTDYKTQHIFIYDNIRDNWMPTVLKKNIGNMVRLLDEAKLLTESKAQFEHVDCSQIQFDFVYLDTYFESWYKSSDESLNKQAQDLSFALQNKMKKYKVPLSDAYGTPDFTEFSFPPSQWKDNMPD